MKIVILSKIHDPYLNFSSDFLQHQNDYQKGFLCALPLLLGTKFSRSDISRNEMTHQYTAALKLCKIPALIYLVL